MNPKFDPSSPEYNKVEDLPKEHQKEFVDVKGGFVRRSALEVLKDAAGWAEEVNITDWGFPTDPVEKTQFLQNEAWLEIGKRKEIQREIDEVINEIISSPVSQIPEAENALKYFLTKEPYIGRISEQQVSRLQEEIEKRK